MIDCRYPSIKGKTEREQIAEIRSFLYQLINELNIAFDAIGSKEQITAEVLAAIKNESGGE
jgi:hypothetical protein